MHLYRNAPTDPQRLLGDYSLGYTKPSLLRRRSQLLSGFAGRCLPIGWVESVCSVRPKLKRAGGRQQCV